MLGILVIWEWMVL